MSLKCIMLGAASPQTPPWKTKNPPRMHGRIEHKRITRVMKCTQRCDLFLVPAEDQASDTLLAFKERTSFGSIISDCWKVYNCLYQEGYEHITVNHSYRLVDPDTLAHANTIEHQWRKAKRKVTLCGHRKKHFARYLVQWMFLTHYQDMSVRLHHFLCCSVTLSSGLGPPASRTLPSSPG